MTGKKREVLRVAVAGSAAILLLVGPIVFAVGVSQQRLDCFDALAERKAPLSEYTYFLGQPKGDSGPAPACRLYDGYFGVLKLACLQGDGQVVSGGGQYSCGASIPALIRHSYRITWRVAASAEERRILRCG